MDSSACQPCRSEKGLMNHFLAPLGYVQSDNIALTLSVQQHCRNRILVHWKTGRMHYAVKTVTQHSLGARLMDLMWSRAQSCYWWSVCDDCEFSFVPNVVRQCSDSIPTMFKSSEIHELRLRILQSQAIFSKMCW